MPPLKKPAYEKFAQIYARHPRVRFNATRAYMEVYPESSYEAALANGPLLVKKTRARILELMDEDSALW